MLIDIATALLLLVIGLLCSVGIFHPSYDDSVSERVGFSITAAWSFMRASAVIDRPHDLGSASELIFYIGLALIMVGAACKALRAHQSLDRDDTAAWPLS